MAYNLRKISPLDLKPSTAIGVKLPFEAQNAFTSVYTTKEQTKYNIINFLLTDKRERIFNANFGAGLRRKIFEQITEDSLETVQQSLITEIENYFPNIQIVTLNVVGQPETNSINIIFSYRLLNSREEDSIVLNIENA